MMPKTRYEMSAALYRGEGSEADWRRTVKEMARFYGWEVLIEIPDKAYETLANTALHTRTMIPVMMAIKGQPDLILGHMRECVAIAVELKRRGGTVKSHQQDRLDLYDRCGIVAYVWETGDPEADRILADPTMTWRVEGRTE